MSSVGRDIKRFSLKLMLFCLPIMITTAPFVALCWYLGLLMPIEQIARQQAENEILYGVSADESGYYKQEVIAARQPDVLLLGSSRVLSFRDEFCNLQPEAFYNAGLRTLDNETMLYFGQRYIDAAVPDVLLLGLDQPYFTVNYERPFIELIDDNFSQNDYLLSQMKGFLLQIPRLNIDEWSQLLNRTEPISGNRAIGTFAILRGVGHRSDGSFQYGQAEIDASIIGSISTPDVLYQPALEISASALDELETLLAYAAQNDVQVIGFFPPFSPHVYATYFAAHPENYTYLPLLTDTIDTLFDDYGYSFYDFTNPENLGLTDAMMLDGWHISERASLMLYLELLAQEPDALGSCSDAAYLQSLLADSEHPFFVLPR